MRRMPPLTSKALFTYACNSWLRSFPHGSVGFHLSRSSAVPSNSSWNASFQPGLSSGSLLPFETHVKTRTNASQRDQRNEWFMAGGISAAADFHKADHQPVLRFLLGAARLRTDAPGGFH